MKKSEIIKTCNQNIEDFVEVSSGEMYQKRGIFSSEALLLISIAKYFNVPHIIESGRARGYSTNLMAKFFQKDSSVNITSIDFDQESEDAKYSESYLSKYNNLNLIYGDSCKLIDTQIEEDCVVFIDGPKGDKAIQLGAFLLKDPRVKAVAIHDLHKNTWHRNICQEIFTDNFFSDDKDYVDTFQYLDKDCWEVLRDTDEAPYTRKGKLIASYASTLGVFFNSETPLVEPAYSNYLAYQKMCVPTFKKAFIENVPHNSWLYKIAYRLYKLF